MNKKLRCKSLTLETYNSKIYRCQLNENHNGKHYWSNGGKFVKEELTWNKEDEVVINE